MQRLISKQLFLVGVLITAAPTLVQAQHTWAMARPDSHAPIGVMGDHMHGQGTMTVSYRNMQMSMDGNRDGTQQLDTGDVLADFMVAPTDMSMSMHMLGFMYAPSDKFTLMAMVNWLDQSMNHDTRMGTSFEAMSSGIGDPSISAMIGIRQTATTCFHLNTGVLLPLGSIEQTGVNPMSMGNAVQLPYPMQIGSGTWDVHPGFTFLGMAERLSWGIQGSAVVRLGENRRGYRRGHGMEGTGWMAVKTSNWISVSGRIQMRRWGNYSGHDEAYGNPMMVPTVRESLRGGTRIDMPLGFNLSIREGALRGHRFAAEWSIPLFQNLNGPQLETDWGLTVGWKKAFGSSMGHDHH